MFKAIMQPYMSADDAIGGGADDFSDVSFDAPEELDSFETEQPTEEAETPTAETEEAPKTEEQQKFKIKFNHQEEEVSYDDAIPLIQKGKNYDSLKEKFDAIQNNPALAKYGKVEEISKLLGYQTDDELLDALYQTHYERTAETQGLTPAQIKKDHELAQRESKLHQDLTATEQTAKQNKMYADFSTNFPDTKAEMIKPETWEKVNAGMDLSAAYTMQQNQDLMNELKVYKQNAENSKKAVIGGVSTHGSVMKSDKIFEGFDD